MGKQVDQGTRLESRLVKYARLVGRTGTRREPKTGVKHEPDVFIPGLHMTPALVWENWYRAPGNERRTPTRMVIISEVHFLELLELDTGQEFGYHVQCKSTEKLSVRSTFEGLLAWMEERS